MLLRDLQSGCGSFNPEVGLRQELGGADRNQFFERLLLVVTGVGNEQSGLRASGVSEVGCAFGCEYFLGAG